MTRERIGRNWYLVNRDGAGSVISQVADDPLPANPVEPAIVTEARQITESRSVSLTQESRDKLLIAIAKMLLDRRR